MFSARTPTAGGYTVLFRNGSLVVQPATCDFAEGELAARGAVQLAVAANVSDQVVRAEYVQAYLCTDGLSLCNGLDVLETRATIEANNSHILAGSDQVYESLDLTLNQNNTLTADSGDTVTFYRSTVRMESNNWVYVTNGSTLSFNNSRLNFSNYLAWSTDGGSTVLSNYSILEFNDAVLYGNRSRWGLVDSTWIMQSGDMSPPGAYAGQIGPLMWFENSDISIQGTLVTLRNYSGLLANTSLLLVNSTLELYNSTLELWASPLGMINSRVVLYDDSEIDFLCGSSTLFEGIITSGSFTTTSNAAAAPRLGQPLGATDAMVVSEPYGIIDMAAPPPPPPVTVAPPVTTAGQSVAAQQQQGGGGR
ncbi:hypothetical protein PLESTM_001891900 [Pleodorina starrii]|nr:hypothetical protein PLESTM_001891900 [Pleodorina starrii]